MKHEEHVVVSIDPSPPAGVLMSAELLSTHLSKVEARAEAKRLASEEDPGEFLVLKAEDWHECSWKKPVQIDSLELAWIGLACLSQPQEAE